MAEFKGLPEEIKQKLLRQMQEEIDSVSVINEKGRPCTLYEIEKMSDEIGKRYKQRFIEELAKYEASEYVKKNSVKPVEKN